MKFHISDLYFLIGNWEGSGYAQFPTIESVEYNESMTFSSNHSDPVIFYEQRSWISSGPKSGKPIFWESGFIIQKENNEFILSNCQKSGRVELSKGKVSIEPDSMKMIFENEINSDPRLERITREYNFNPEVITYKLNMKMKNVDKHQNHLRAFLKMIK